MPALKPSLKGTFRLFSQGKVTTVYLNGKMLMILDEDVLSFQGKEASEQLVYEIAASLKMNIQEESVK